MKGYLNAPPRSFRFLLSGISGLWCFTCRKREPSTCRGVPRKEDTEDLVGGGKGDEKYSTGLARYIYRERYPANFRVFVLEL